MATIAEIRPSPIAGTWYQGDPERLAKQIDGFIQAAKLPDLKGEVVGLIAPHAGHRYSGRTAGYAFRSVLGQQRDLVAVVSPLHGFFPEPLLTSAHQAYATPLGTVPVDREAVYELDRCLRQEANIHLTAVANDSEHSLEIELPFLQRALVGGFKLLPVMIRSQTPSLAGQLGRALAEVIRQNGSRHSVLLVASTDLSHFYSEIEANRLDAEMLKQIGLFSPEGVLEAEHSGRGYACGFMAVASVMYAARELGANAVEVLHHSTSADETGDHDSVVGYGAAVLLKRS
ncbi:MAG TPA: AmmeMemoRadiSam system protein B [Anaerolineaceae bacterium]|nr:AmmeMemoRadiSam system protein B [Anaerolineaceae bacterium]